MKQLHLCGNHLLRLFNQVHFWRQISHTNPASAIQNVRGLHMVQHKMAGSEIELHGLLEAPPSISALGFIITKLLQNCLFKFRAANFSQVDHCKIELKLVLRWLALRGQKDHSLALGCKLEVLGHLDWLCPDHLLLDHLCDFVLELLQVVLSHHWGSALHGCRVCSLHFVNSTN